MDVKAFFDSVPWELVCKAVQRHATQPWVMLYVRRWLQAPMLMPDGSLAHRTKGTPQGGPISPLIADVFLHYGFDTWMAREYPALRFERFVDDVVVHCVTERQAHQVREAIGRRFADIGLQLHPDKTRVVYCKDDRCRLDFDRVTFTFCGYAFRPRETFVNGRRRTGFLPAVAPEKLASMSRKVASWRLHRRTTGNLADLAEEINPALRGWLNYFTTFYPSEVTPIGKRVDRHLMRWARWKYQRLRRSEPRARAWLQGVRKRSPGLFAHWTLSYTT